MYDVKEWTFNILCKIMDTTLLLSTIEALRFYYFLRAEMPLNTFFRRSLNI